MFLKTILPAILRTEFLMIVTNVQIQEIKGYIENPSNFSDNKIENTLTEHNTFIKLIFKENLLCLVENFKQ